LSTYHRIITGGRPDLPAAQPRPEPPLTSKITISGWSISLSAEALVWEASLRRRVLASADEDVTTVGETFIRFGLGDATWEGFPVPIKQMFTDNGPAIVAEVTGGFLQVDQAALGTIDQPTLLVAAAHSPEAFRQVIDAMAAALPNSRTHLIEGGHLINPADPAVLGFLEELAR
jgi:pimeloyl-ACP methyl ester carboxylesterase